MSLIRINWKPDVKERRKFGVAMLVGFGVIALLLYMKQHNAVALGCLAFGVASGSLGLTGTALVLPVYWLWMAIAFVMGNIISRLILMLFYYFVMTPIALFMRLRGRDRLDIHGKSESYWKPVQDASSNYERQF